MKRQVIYFRECESAYWLYLVTEANKVIRITIAN